MKVSRLFLFVLLFSVTLPSMASWDIYKSGLSLNGAYYDCLLNTAAPDFQNRYFGRFTSSGTLTLDFTEVLTYKNGASNVCSANLQYRVYRTSDAPPAFTTLSAPFCCNNGTSNACSGFVTCGPDVNNPGDQKWKGTPAFTNLIAALTLPGTYVIEVYYDATGDDAGGCSNTKYSSNGGVNYRAYFEYENNDSFTDLDFSTPTWTGDVANYTIIANSNTSGLTGSEAYRTHTIRLNATGTDTQSISTQIATWNAQQEWYFWLGRNGNGAAPQDFDANNQQAVYLYSSTSNLESGSCDGFRILIGSNATSYIRLQKITAGSATTIFTSSVGIPNGLTDYGVSFKVTRSQLGVWTIRTSTLPTNGLTTQSTPTPNSAPEVLSTVNHGSVTDNSYAAGITAGNGYFGFQATHDNSTEGVQAAEFDNFRFKALPADTYLELSLASGSVAEDAALAGNVAIAVNILNASGVSATTVDLVRISGSASRIGGGLVAATAYAPSYTTQTLSWAAGVSTTKYFYIDPDDNALCDDIATLVFQLQNPTGGTNAFVGPTDTYTLSVIDDNMGYETLINENFNAGTLTNWVTTGTSWSANTTTPIEGSHSARHSTQAGAGSSSLTYPLDGASLLGINTTWRFEIDFQNDATANNNFQIFLSADRDSLFSANTDGYAVVIDQSSLPSAGSSDYIRLYRVDNGTYATTPIVNSTTDWLSNVNSGVRVGFEVTLNDAGTWDLKVDANGGFDALSSLGTGVDLIGGGLTYPTANRFGVRFKYLPAASDLFRFDSVTMSQNGCKELWYSQGTGNSDGAIWDDVMVGTGAVVVAGRYDRFVVQTGHNVTVNNSWITQSVGINNGGTLTGGSSNLYVYENFVNDGTFVPGTSTVIFKGQSAQNILGSVSTTFNHLKVDNDGSNLTLTTASSVKGVVRMEEGTLQTGGILTLLSDGTGSGSIGEIKSGAAVSGNVTLQRYIPSIPNVYGQWVNLGCPIAGQTIADWNDDIVTTGFTGADYPPPYPFNSIQYYNESANGTMNTGYVTATNVTNALSNSQGYFVWLQGATQNLDNTGAIQTGTFTNSLSYTITGLGGIFDWGWNLMTNPYPSEVDWNMVSAGLSGPKVYYVYDFQTNAYKYRNATTNSGTASRYIPHSQSFLVKVNVAGQNLNYQENYKSENATAFERSEESTSSFIALQLSRNGMSDEGMLMFMDNAISEYDNSDVFDLESISNEAVEFSLMSADNVGLAQDARPFNNNIHIPVKLDMPAAGSYVFSVAETQNLPFGACLYVEDTFTGNTMNLLPGESMTIYTDAPFNGNRLIIHGTAPVTSVITDASCNGGADGSLDITTPAGDWSVSLSGDTDIYEYVSAGSITFDHLAAGVYMLQVTNSNNGCGNHSAEIVIAEPAAVHAEIADVQIVPCNSGTSGRIEWNVANSNWFTYEILNSAGAVVNNGEVESNFGFVENLPADLYTLNIYTTCSSQSLNIDLRDPQSAQFMTVVPENVYMENGIAEVPLYATSVGSSEVHWILSNGMQLSGEMVNVQIDEPGVYSYAASTVSNCTLTSTGTFEVSLASSVDNQNAANSIALLQLENGIQLTFRDTYSNQALVKIYDMQGREVWTQKVNASKGQVAFIDMNTFSAGIYNLQVVASDTKVFSSRVYKR